MLQYFYQSYPAEEQAKGYTINGKYSGNLKFIISNRRTHLLDFWVNGQGIAKFFAMPF